MNVLKEMKIVRVREEENQIIVTTTGAKYVIDKSGEMGKISCFQQLNKKRLTATIDFNYSFSTLSVERQDDCTCVLHQELRKGQCLYLKLQINSDSLLDIYSCGELNLTISSDFLPHYRAEKNGNILLIDSDGGVGIYPYQGLRNAEFVTSNGEALRINYTMNDYCRLFISIFPPRKFNYTQSYEERVVHHGRIGPWVVPPFPTDKMLEEAGRYANVLVLHEGIWQGKLTRKGKTIETVEDTYSEASFACFDYLPLNERELVRVVKKAHSLGMKVIPYMSPFFSMAKGRDFLDRVENIITKYDMDGVYFDGISADILDSYKIIRDARSLLGDKILYVHCTDDPLMSRNIYCPFIDTYADYILRAEHDTYLTDNYFRYVISGYNISNAIGYICYYDFPMDFIRKTIDKILAVNARFYLGLPETEREKLLKEEYFSRLEERLNENRLK
jgi:hypothetical protein